MIIRVQNSLHEKAPLTYLTNTEAAGTTIFRVRNMSAFGSSWAIQVGETGESQTEVLLLAGNPTQGGTLGTSTAASLYEHPSDTPVYGIKFNQIVFERSTVGTAGTATAITDGTVTYQANSEHTIFDDTSGSLSYGYRVAFRNSVLGTNSVESDWLTPAGPTFYSLSKIRQRIKDKLWNSDYITDDHTIDDWINEWKDEMANSVISVNQDYALGTADFAFGTSGLGTITTGDFKQVRRFEVTYNGIDYYLSTKSYISDNYPDEVFSSTHPYHYYLGNTVFRVLPSDTAGTARLTFYQFGTTMVNDTDELPQPMKSFTKSFVDYGEAQALRKDGKNDWQTKLGEAQNSKQEFVNQLSPRDQSSQQQINIVEPTSGDDLL